MGQKDRLGGMSLLAERQVTDQAFIMQQRRFPTTRVFKLRKSRLPGECLLGWYFTVRHDLCTRAFYQEEEREDDDGTGRQRRIGRHG